MSQKLSSKKIRKVIKNTSSFSEKNYHEKIILFFQKIFILSNINIFKGKRGFSIFPNILRKLIAVLCYKK